MKKIMFCIWFAFLICGCKKMIKPTEVHGTIFISDSINNNEKTILIFAKNDHDKQEAQNFINKYNSDPYSIVENDYKSITNVEVNELGNYLYEFNALLIETKDIACFAWRKNYIPGEMKNVSPGKTNLLNFELKPMNRLYIKFIFTGLNGSGIEKCTIKTISDPEEVILKKDNSKIHQSIVSFMYQRTKLNTAGDLEIKAYNIYNECIYTEILHLQANESKLIERKY